MINPYPHLFSPISIGRLEIPNRIVMSPMGTNYAADTGAVSDRLIRHYVERARGGTGLIIVENTTVQYPLGRGGARHLRIDADEFTPGLNRLAEAVQRQGARVAIQLNHSGALTSAARAGATPVGPSDVPVAPGGTIPRPLTIAEIDEIVRYFVAAGLRAQKAGFDAIEVHGAHGYLLSEFLSPYTNRRTDEYGGSLENRLRFPLRVIQGLRHILSLHFPIWMRINGEDFVEGGLGLDEVKVIAQALVAAGLDALHVSAALPSARQKQVEPMRYEQGWKLYLATAIRNAVGVPVMATSVIREPAFAEQAIAEGQTDLVVIGRGLLADPNWANKAACGQAERINRCISCNVCLWSRSVQDIGLRCTVNPFLGREEDLDFEPAVTPKRVMVVGGGPAGMEAAWAASQRGHQVTLCEQTDRLGGMLQIGSRPPGKDKLLWLLDMLNRQLVETHVDIRLSTRVTRDIVEYARPDVVILATGTLPWLPPLQGLESPNVVIAWDVLRDEVSIENEQVAIIGGGMVACETAVLLAGQGNRVTLVEMLEDLAQDVEPTTRMDLLQHLSELGIRSYVRCQARLVQADGVYCELQDGQEVVIPAERVVLSAGSRPARELADELRAVDIPFRLIGDCRQPRQLVHAIYDGLLAGLAV